MNKSIKDKDNNKLNIIPFNVNELCMTPSITMIAKRTSGCRWLRRDELYKFTDEFDQKTKDKLDPN